MSHASGSSNWFDAVVDAMVRADAAELAARVVSDHPIGALTTYRVGGTATAFVVVEDPSELIVVARAATAVDCATMVIGRGSNLLVADAGVDALVVQLGDGFAGVDVRDADSADPEVSVRAGGAAMLPVVARLSVAAGWTGFEWAVGVPGSIGGSVRMNAGGHGSEMSASVVRVRAIDLDGGEDEAMTAEQLDFGYRHSSLRATQVVVSVDLRLARADEVGSDTDVPDLAEIVKWRRDHQPGGQNAGSVFRNPAHASAGALIESAGCKGLRVGSAEVSTKHANFIQVDSGGCADDVLELMTRVRQRVRAAAGIDLVAETHVVGAPNHLCEAAGVLESAWGVR